MPDSNDGKTHLGAYVPHNHAEAIFQLAQHRSTRTDKTTQSDLIREAIKQYLHTEAREDRIPDDIRELLNDRLIADSERQKEAGEA